VWIQKAVWAVFEGHAVIAISWEAPDEDGCYASTLPGINTVVSIADLVHG
jgi:hypothetical protein